MSTKRNLDLQAILNVAAELAEEKGLENVTLLLVAERLGVKSPALYNHLHGLKELSSGIASLAVNRLADALRTAAVGRSGTEALLAMARSYRQFAKENPELYKAILRFPTCADQGVQETGHAVVQILYQVLEPCACSREEVLHFARGFRSVLHGFVALEEAGFFQDAAADVEVSFERLVLRWISTLTEEKAA